MVAAEAVRFQRTSTSPYPAGGGPSVRGRGHGRRPLQPPSAAAWLRAPCDGPAFDPNGGDGGSRHRPTRRTSGSSLACADRPSALAPAAERGRQRCSSSTRPRRRRRGGPRRSSARRRPSSPPATDRGGARPCFRECRRPTELEDSRGRRADRRLGRHQHLPAPDDPRHVSGEACGRRSSRRRGIPGWPVNQRAVIGPQAYTLAARENGLRLAGEPSLG